MKLNFISVKNKNSIEADYFSYLEMEKIATINQVTPYEIDKILWLIGSGKFYLSDKKIKGQKEAFIEHVKKKTGLNRRP